MGKFAELVPERVRALASYIPGKPIQQAEAESGVKMIKLVPTKILWTSPLAHPGHGNGPQVRSPLSRQ